MILVPIVSHACAGRIVDRAGRESDQSRTNLTAQMANNFCATTGRVAQSLLSDNHIDYCS